MAHEIIHPETPRAPRSRSQGRVRHDPALARLDVTARVDPDDREEIEGRAVLP